MLRGEVGRLEESLQPVVADAGRHGGEHVLGLRPGLREESHESHMNMSRFYGRTVTSHT